MDKLAKLTVLNNNRCCTYVIETHGIWPLTHRMMVVAIV